jgi:hypothetical protein
VLEVLHVHIQNIIVGTEDNIDIPHSTHLALGDELDPPVIEEFAFEFKVDIFGIITNHNGIVFACKVKSKQREMQKNWKSNLLFIPLKFSIDYKI